MIKDRSTNILFITHYSEMYGANKSLCQLLVELKSHHNIKPIVLIRMDGSITKFLEENHIPYIISHFYWWVYEKKGLKARLHNIIKQRRNFYKLQAIYKKIGQRPLDLVYSNSITVNIGFFIARKYKCPHVWHLRESLEQFQFTLGTGNLLARLFLAKAAHRYILISDYLVKFYKNLLPMKKMVRIYNGIEPPVIKREIGIEFDVINLCMLGIISDQKNQMDAVNAINLLVNNRNLTNIHLHMAGSAKGKYLAKLMNQIKSRKLERYITYYGHISDVNKFLMKMDIGLVCARDEAFGRVSIEYMMNVMPVIASISGANQELVIEGENGISYELYNPTDLADKIQLFLQQPDMIPSMGDVAYKYAITNFTSKNNAIAIKDLIAEVTGR